MSDRDNRGAPRQNAPTNRGAELKYSSTERRKISKKRVAGVVIPVLIVLTVICAFVLTAYVFKAKNIEVTNGNVCYSDEEILATAGIEQNKGFLFIYFGGCAKKVEKNLPYVGKLEVKFRLPDTVEVTVNYTHEVFAFKSAGGYALLDETGKVLRIGSADRWAAGAVEGLSLSSVVLGETASFADIIKETEAETDNAIEKETQAPSEPEVLMTGSEIFEKLKALAEELSDNELSEISEYSITQSKSGKLNVSVVIDDMIEIDFGLLSSASSKARLAKKIVDENSQKASADNKLMIDLTDEKTGYVRTQNAIDKVEEDVSNAAAKAEETTAEGESTTTAAEENTD